MIYTKFLPILVLVLIAGCSEYEREQFLEKIKEYTLTAEERKAKRIKESRIKIMEQSAYAEIQQHFINQYNKKGKSYKSIHVNWVNVQRDFFSDISISKEDIGKKNNHALTVVMLGLVDYPIAYEASYSVTIEEENFLTATTIDIEGNIYYFFKKNEGSELAHRAMVMDERLVAKNTYSTGRGEKTVEMIGSLLDDKN